MNEKYDYIIVGTGPAGLALSWYLSQENKKILLIDSEKSIGGCHRVIRVDGLLTEHGPRVYSDVYLNFIDLLKEMKIDFNDLFTPYTFDISNIGNRSKTSLNFNEILSFGTSFFNLILDSNYGKDISMKKFMETNTFTPESIDYIDRLCRLTDGAETTRYTLFQFLQLINNQILYKLYQPKKPNDLGLLYLMEKKLKETNLITILLNHEVISVNSNSKNIITSITVNNKSTNESNIFIGSSYILAIPPKPLYKILSNSPDARNSFGTIEKLSKWSEENSYFDYIPITLHWKDKIELKKIWGFPASDWGLAFIILSNYMKFDGPNDYQTVISACITYTDRKSSVTNKTADESTMDEINNEVLRQLRESYPDLENPDRMITSPQVYYNDEQKKWINIDTAYVTTINYANLPFQSEQFSNLYNCGAQNGKSNYHFTSLETAVVNSLNLFYELINKPTYIRQIKNYNKITNYIHLILIVLMILGIIYFYRKKYIV